MKKGKRKIFIDINLLRKHEQLWISEEGKIISLSKLSFHVDDTLYKLFLSLSCLYHCQENNSRVFWEKKPKNSIQKIWISSPRKISGYPVAYTNCITLKKKYFYDIYKVSSSHKVSNFLMSLGNIWNFKKVAMWDSNYKQKKV